MKPRILHIAPQNFAGMPYDFMMMQRNASYDSRLITIYKNSLNFPEDITLGFNLPTGKAAKKWRNSKIEGLKYYKAENFLENWFFMYRDFMNNPDIQNAIKKYKLDDYDYYHFDGGMDFYRDLRFAKHLYGKGKKIICCYYGSDLRTRGIFEELDKMSSLNLTVEFDHIKLHKDIHYLFFPFNVYAFEYNLPAIENLKIIHSPTNRLYKGTDKIINVIEQLKKNYSFEFILAENINRDELLKIKSKCSLAIDQVGGILGGSGYGKNSIENLSMGLPTITEFYKDYLNFLPENPFITSNIKTLYDDLESIFLNPEKLINYSKKGRKWVEKYHSFESVNEKLEKYYEEYLN